MDDDGQGRETLLVVGAGLPGAILAWVAARAGYRVTVASLARPGGRATALHPGVVHGPGPPVPPVRWSTLPGHALAAAGRRAREGRRFFHGFLLENDDPVGVCPLPSEVMLAGDDGGDPAQLASCLAAAGFPVEIDRGIDGVCVLRRKRDALLLPRRLVFALLRRARALGAEILLGVPAEGWRVEAGGGVVARLGGAERRFGRLAWTPDRPPPGKVREGPWRASIVLLQERQAGPEPLDRILLGPGGMAVVAPHPARSGRVILVRHSRVDPGGEIDWPSLPPAFLPYLGSALRQRLAEVFEGPLEREFSPEEPLAVLSGLAHWPIASVFGLAADLLRAWGAGLPAVPD